MSGVYVRRAREADVGALVALERAGAERPWDAAAVRSAVVGPARSALLAALAARDREAVVAYCAFQVAGGELEIHGLLVEPAWRRQRLGRLLLELALRDGARRDAQVALLEVREGNSPALALYRDAGFAPVGRRRGYYPGPAAGSDALVLARPLGGGTGG